MIQKLYLGEQEETIEDVTVSQDVIETEETIEDIEYKKRKTEEDIFVYKLQDCNVRKHEDAAFELKLPKPRTKVKWLKDGVPITESDKFTIEVIIGLINQSILVY